MLAACWPFGLGSFHDLDRHDSKEQAGGFPLPLACPCMRGSSIPSHLGAVEEAGLVSPLALKVWSLGFRSHE